MRSMHFYAEAWPLHTAFVIARGSRTEAKVVVVKIEQQGMYGVGECTPYARYGESEASVMQQLAEVLPAVLQGATRQDLQRLMPAGAARNAVDSALWNLECHLNGQDLWQLSGIQAPQRVVMAQTIAIGTPEAMAFAAREQEIKGATLLKIKLDDRFIRERLVAIRAAVPRMSLIVDANESWQAKGLEERCQLLTDLGVAMLEQPLPATDDSALENFVHPLPICADESCHTSDDLVRLSRRYQMVNIKLDKTGGLTEGLKLAEQARLQGFDIMLGCMLCTSRAIAAALPLVPGARFVDLDGPTWLANDIKLGLAFACGAINL
ncbi:L-Ala-D/L-Glu epimerase [Serratia sp. UGAL515B_01]|uniref:L-Ala-D/L-Glu epimerase n=1 Tax=Serratia sp. UGAL515B_01 TaxID=2986763 RepID=UPI00295532E3|nr:L-Ala-D/L-Glu epimerase [Serratia sp. UGAL515B_01]WON78674.1 L-Ala-D/L-Glu epimerase [Serratia sp. UGAL515B_01]